MNATTALLIIDAQVNMFAATNPVYGSERLLTTLRALLARARKAGILIVYVQNNGGSGDPDQPETPGWQIHPDLTPRKSDVVIQKWTPDAFYQTLLQEELATHGMKQVILAGMQTEYCIDTTCRRAFTFDYQITLVKDGHSTYATNLLSAAQVIAHHNAILRAFAAVVDAETIDFTSTRL
ncbi:MAG TPA: isochorismatase family protein [Ktedonobacteraceae bacterium]